MTSFEKLYQALAGNQLAPWADQIKSRIDLVLEQGHGDLFRWQGILNQLPSAVPSIVDLARPRPDIGCAEDMTEADRNKLESLLMQLHPWRKGPFDLFGIHIDGEWRSDLKWQRLAGQIESLSDRLVLDVGGGNGYYALRMVGAGARFVLSIDPTWLFIIQFLAIKHYLPQVSAHVAPLGIELLPGNMAIFDTVFSMGVLYHRRSPISHLLELRSALRPGGQLVLETLVIESARGKQGVLVPESRYAKMRNVWFIPSLPILERWLQTAGFENIAVIDQSITTSNEQRRTDWMRFESLSDYLDPADPRHTIEGHPAPIRAILTAQKPS